MARSFSVDKNLNKSSIILIYLLANEEEVEREEIKRGVACRWKLVVCRTWQPLLTDSPATFKLAQKKRKKPPKRPKKIAPGNSGKALKKRQSLAEIDGIQLLGRSRETLSLRPLFACRHNQK